MSLSLIFCLAFLFLPQAKTHQELDPVIKSIERMVDFYHADFESLNIDGLFGLRVLEGHFSLILDKYDSKKLGHLDPNVAARIRLMKSKASKTATLAIQHVKKDDFEYYSQLSYVVGSPWTVFDDTRRKVDPSKIWGTDVYHRAKKSVKLDEKISDQCMSELIGSQSGSQCDISVSCVKTMTSPGLVGYGLTHQILWTMLGEKAGCKDSLNQKLAEIDRGTLVSLRQEMCTNNFYQLKDTLGKMKNGVIIPVFQDLFLEQLFVCPSLGYYEFLHLDFLKQILSWQLEPGCFGKMKNPETSVKLENSLTGKFNNDYIDKEKDDYYEDFKQLLEGIQVKDVDKDGSLLHNNYPGGGVEQHKPGVESWDIPANKGRKLLMEKEMTGGCLAHKTAVASGALVIYLRFLCEADASVTFNKTRLTRSTNNSNNFINHDLNIAGHIFQPGDEMHDKNNDQGDEKDEASEKKKLSFVKANNLIQGDKADNVPVPNKVVVNDDNVVKDSVISQGDLDVKNDMADLNHHLNQLNVPDLNEQNGGRKDLGYQIAPFDNIPHAINNGLNQAIVPDQGNNGDQDVGDDQDGDDYNDENDDDEDDDQNNNDDDYDNADNDNQDNANNDENDDDYYDERNVKAHAFPKDGANFDLNQPQVKNDLNDNDEDYADENDDDDNDDDEYDAGYDDNDKNNVDGIGAVHPHINVRNIGHRDYRLNDADLNDDRNLSKDYKNRNEDEEEDDEDGGDDYDYDDENDEMAKRRQEELKGDVQFDDSARKSFNNKPSAIHKDLLHRDESISPTTAFFVFAFCMTLVLILMYKFIRKRRIRIRFNPKYFSV